MRSLLGVSLIVLTLAACSPKSNEGGYADAKIDMPAAEAAAEMPVATDVSGVNLETSAIEVSSLPQLAYDYRYGYAAPRKDIEALSKADLATCQKAGTAECQMISMSAHSYTDANNLNQTLELRVSPAYLKTFQSGMDDRLKSYRARINNQSVTSEDLSLQIVDTEARIKNKEALRDRLAQIVRTGSGKISELVEAERQLAETQADIDSAKSQLLVMKKRVATVHLTLEYQSEAVAASRGTFAPVNDALKGALGNMMEMLGFLITLLAYNLPLMILATPAFIFGRKAWIKWRAKKTDQGTKAP